MVDSPSPRSSGPILCFVLGLRYAGFAALDGFGLAPSGFRSVNLKRRPAQARGTFLAQAVVRAFRIFRPSGLVLSVPKSCRSVARVVLKSLRRLAKRLGVPLVQRDPRAGLEYLLGRVRQARRDELAHALMRHFRLDDALPKRGRGAVNLAARVARYGERARCHHAAWQATALALMELTEQRPFAAGALLREGVGPLRPYERALTAAANRV